MPFFRSCSTSSAFLISFVSLAQAADYPPLSRTDHHDPQPAVINASELDQRIQILWRSERPLIADEFQHRLERGDMEVLYAVELWLHNLVEYARQTRDFGMIRDLIELNLPSLNRLQEADGNLMWICSDACGLALKGKEYILASTQYLYLLSSLMNALLDLPTRELSTTDREFVTRLTPVLLSHYWRWIYGPKIYRSWWSDCTDPDARFNYNTTLDWKLAEPQTGMFYEYCKVVHDVEMLMVGGVIELLGASRKKPRIVTLNSAQYRGLRAFTVKFATLLKKRLIRTNNLKNWRGARVPGLILDPGAFRLHPDWLFAGYDGTEYPTATDRSVVDNVSWDVSHYRRLVHLLKSYDRHSDALSLSFPSRSLMTAQINQFTYAVFDESRGLPLFRTFTDGANGWFRVDYEGQLGFAYAPYKHSATVAEGGYGFWAADHPDWRRVMTKLYRYLEDNRDSERRGDYYWTDGHGHERSDLMYLPSLVPLTQPFIPNASYTDI